MRTEYGEMQSISRYSFEMQKNMDQKKSKYVHFWRSVGEFLLSYIIEINPS